MNTTASTQSSASSLEFAQPGRTSLLESIVARIARLGQMKRVLVALLGAFVLTFILTSMGAEEISAFPAKLLLGVVGCMVFYVFDRHGFNEVDTISLIRRDPNAYTTHLRSYALILAASLLAF